ncbi:MAG: rod shape-determining protein RodA [Lentisphaerae bacterium]|nr:rod shape-determining protein RodA [Lentisphaerota bacterium]
MAGRTENIFSLTRMSWVLTLAILLLLVAGVLFVYSSCYVNPEQPVRTLYLKQVMWALVGLMCYLIFAMIDYHKLGTLSWWAYAVCILLLVLVLFIGKRIYGARRWLMLFGIGIQPSEFAKVAVVIVLANVLSQPGLDFRNVKVIGLILTIVALPVFLIMKEPDLGTAMIFVPTAMVMLFVAGMPIKTLVYMVVMAVVVVLLLLGVLFLPGKLGLSQGTQDRFREMTGISEYQKKRIEVFLNPSKDPRGAGWNKRQSEIAVGSGKTWGRGWTKGKQNMLGFLPRSVAPTDFIYSVIAEEAGFVGSMAVLFLFSVIVTTGLMTAVASWDQVGRLLCVGIVAMLFCHAFINISMTVGLMPITGLPLPLLSYGGSFMVVMMSALGIVQSVRIRSRHVESFR